MQLGTRWPVGAAAPDRLPPAMLAAVHAVEQELDGIGQDVAGWGWTLTYLEQQPLVDLDDGTRIRYIAESGTAVIGSADEPDPGDEASGTVTSDTVTSDTVTPDTVMPDEDGRDAAGPSEDEPAAV